MDDYISRADAIEAFERGRVYHKSGIEEIINALPSADAVPIEKYHELQHQFVMLGAVFADLTEVVRCKDCRHRVHDEERGLYYCEMYYGQGDVSDENFCQWGERREE